MSNSKRIPREQWSAYFDACTKRFFRDDQPEVATISLMSRFTRARTAVRGARMIGITYDKHDDVLDVALEGVDHLVYHPTEIRVAEDADGFPREFLVEHKGGQREVIALDRIGSPASAPAASEAASGSGVDRRRQRGDEVTMQARAFDRRSSSDSRCASSASPLLASTLGGAHAL